jgi:hypothetical protein
MFHYYILKYSIFDGAFLNVILEII